MMLMRSRPKRVFFPKRYYHDRSYGYREARTLKLPDCTFSLYLLYDGLLINFL
jgi:hypothetical protein